MPFDNILKNNEYLSLSDLRYTDKCGKKLSSAELRNFLDYKDSAVKAGADGFFRLDLFSPNSESVFFCRHPELLNFYSEYLSLVNTDDVFGSNREEMRRARIYSEVEGSLNIEGYNSTRALFDDLTAGREPVNTNEVIIRNMSKAIRFVEDAPAFNEENFFRLYSILSDSCLTDSQMLRPGEKYRYDMVFVSSYNGAAVEDLPVCMDSLFAFVNANRNSADPLLRFLLPHIVHYYIVFVHPYFDCNGRMARMCSLWTANLVNIGESPYFISEAINDSKNEYYKALSAARDARNDLTYFFLYILKTSVRYALCYRSMNCIRERLQLSGDSLTPSEENYLKKIILCSGEKYFSWKDFILFTGSGMTKQGALKTLNALEQYHILTAKINSRKEKVFTISV